MRHPEVVDFDSTASESDSGRNAAAESNAKSRRRLPSAEIESKVEWTDDDDDDNENGDDEILQILSVGRNKRRRTEHKDDRRPTQRSTKTRKGDRRNDAGGKRQNTLTGGVLQRGAAEPVSGRKGGGKSDDHIPDYVLQRRAAFSSRLSSLRRAGLRLPPDYTGLTFEPRAEPTRPNFGTDSGSDSGIKPCRPYADIALPESGGVIPAVIAQYLRDYQVAGVRFLHRLFVYQTGGILGDDMGLGKTVQVAAFLAVAFGKTGAASDAQRMRRMRAANRWYPRALVVCPGSLIANWRAELQCWGFWHIDVLHGAAAHKADVLQAARTGHVEVVITTYDTYKNSRALVNLVEWDVLIADECHRIRDRLSLTTAAMREANALCRIGLTGTAIQNSYDELWTLLDWAAPGRFGSHTHWTALVTRPLVLGQAHDATLAEIQTARQTARQLVQRLLPPVFLRRVKALIAAQLPRKTDRVVFCPLTAVQRAAYTAFLDADDVATVLAAHQPCSCGATQRLAGSCCHKTTADGRPWRSCVFAAMLTLQKLANHVALLLPAAGDGADKREAAMRTLRMCLPEAQCRQLYAERDSMVTLADPELCGKWKILKKLLRVWHGNGDKVLVFSHSVRLLRMLQLLFSNTSYTVSYLDGGLSYEERARAVADFNADPRQFVFLISTRAGGVGLNITSANKVVIVDPHWNPAYDLQAQDRAYRIGQTRDVDVFRLIAAGTIEEIVYARQIYKQQQANIGYVASSEHRYFCGVQYDDGRRGDIFGLDNIFGYRGDELVLRDIVNKTNVAEAMVGVTLAEVDMDQAVRDGGAVAKMEFDGADEDADAAAMVGLAAVVTGAAEPAAEHVTRPDPIAALLAEAGVEYTHENAALLGSSAVEEKLSTAAWADEHGTADSLNALAARRTRGLKTAHYVYNPPEEVMVRQFCEMARTLGFSGVTEFALAVEGGGKEERRRFLEEFYRRRRAVLEGEEEDIKREEQQENIKTEEEEGDIKKEEQEEGDIKREEEEEEEKHTSIIFISDNEL